MKLPTDILRPFFPEKLKTREETLGRCVPSINDVSPTDLQGRIAILGIPDDRGIILNHGNPGAKQGPEAFRKAFYTLYAGDKAAKMNKNLVEAGDINLSEDILTTHQNLSLAIAYLLEKKCRSVIVIGGGHDFSFASFSAIDQSFKTIIPCINFDAHFDLRPVINDELNSGTPFFRILENFPNSTAGGKTLLEVGIQKDRNPDSLYQFADSRGVGVIEKDHGAWKYNKEQLSNKNTEKNAIGNRLDSNSRTEVAMNRQLWSMIEKHLELCGTLGWNYQKDPIHLSLDLDVFASWVAPGTSASTPFGLNLDDLMESLEILATKASVIDIAELCPARDINHQTARLAAGIVYRMLDKMIVV